MTNSQFNRAKMAASKIGDVITPTFLVDTQTMEALK
jgi:hypothetical protein